MKFAVNVPNFGWFAEPRNVAKLAETAEDAGWDGLFIWDHLLVWSGNEVGDPWIALAAAAMVTERTKIGTRIRGEMLDEGLAILTGMWAAQSGTLPPGGSLRWFGGDSGQPGPPLSRRAR